MHEDKLNWNKLGTLLTVNIFLCAGYAYFWNNPPIRGGAYHVWGLFVLILLINWSFKISIESGIKYMLQRKEQVIYIEEKLTDLDQNIQPIVRRLPGKSATIKWLERLPIISLFVWIMSIFALIIRIIYYGHK